MIKTKETEILKTPVFTVVEKEFENTNFKPVGLKCNDWVTVVAIDNKDLNKANTIVVEQTRWGSENKTIEFPCGTVEFGEMPSMAAKREFEEETGIKIVCFNENTLYTRFFNPNPAYFNNTMGVFVVYIPNLKTIFNARGEQKLDKNEDCRPSIIPFKEVFDKTTHGLMLSALSCAVMALN